ncbi:hypothetical protein [Rubripirellula reticaptiva]|uniref:Uncharacterized protein n=1 Tax=Rubripirellula reticaptiva TaxID=2528013 RepID=A0A5C6EZT1_9BACT|nr:hypothetical protein [Rubripirellula reticaptiva]TWU55143.1 hypothetical protein Poly59_14390 [Rubripirellula reticaptiva]
MRNLIIIGMLGVAAFMAGWFKINRDGDSTTIEINRAEIRSDARKAIEKGREVLDRREQEDQRYANDPNASYGQPPGQFPPQGQQPYPPQGEPYNGNNGFGQPASYAQPGYPPPSYGSPYPQGQSQQQPYGQNQR